MSAIPSKDGNVQNSAKADSRHGHDQFFHLYNAKSEDQDQDFLNDCNDAMDSLLVFAGLFSAVTTALIVESYKDLKPDPNERTEQLLAALLRRSGDLSAPYELSPQAQFSATTSAIVTNAFFFLSLCVSLSAALCAILIKQWARNFLNGLTQISSAPRRARKRFQRSCAVKKWRFSRVIAWVPMMLHLSLFLFFAGLIIWLRSLNEIIFSITIILVGAACIFYIGGATITSFDPNAPFEWPIAVLIRRTVLRRVARRQGAQDSMPLVERSSTSLTMITTPLDNFDSTAYDSSSLPTRLDIPLISDFLDRADTYVEIEAALQQFYQIITNSDIQISEIPTESVNNFIRCAAELVLACRAYDHNLLTVQRGAGFQRATTAIRFFEAILQITSVDLSTCGDLLRSASGVIQLYHAHTLQLQDPRLMALSASCLSRMASQLESDVEMVSLVESAPLLMRALVQLGPNPIGPIRLHGSTASPPAVQKWSMEAVRQYQVSITAYLASFIQLLVTCDAKGLKPNKEAIEGVFESSRRLVTNSRVVVIKGNVENHPILLDFLKSRWNNFYGPENDQMAPQLVQHLISYMGHEAIIVDGGRHEVVNGRERKRLIIPRTVDAH